MALNSINSNNKFKKGDKIKVINAITYAGSPFRLYQNEYNIIMIDNDKAVIGIDNIITAVVNVKNIRKI